MKSFALALTLGVFTQAALFAQTTTPRTGGTGTGGGTGGPGAQQPGQSSQGTPQSPGAQAPGGGQTPGGGVGQTPSDGGAPGDGQTPGETPQDPGDGSGQGESPVAVENWLLDYPEEATPWVSDGTIFTSQTCTWGDIYSVLPDVSVVFGPIACVESSFPTFGLGIASDGQMSAVAIRFFFIFPWMTPFEGEQVAASPGDGSGGQGPGAGQGDQGAGNQGTGGAPATGQDDAGAEGPGAGNGGQAPGSGETPTSTGGQQCEPNQQSATPAA